MCNQKKMTIRLTQLGIILLLALGVYLILSYSNQRVTEEFIPDLNTVNFDDGKKIRELCLNGTQSEKSRVCPYLIKQGTELHGNLAQACLRFKTGGVDFAGVHYGCYDHQKLGNEIRTFTESLRH